MTFDGVLSLAIVAASSTWGGGVDASYHDQQTAAAETSRVFGAALLIGGCDLGLPTCPSI